MKLISYLNYLIKFSLIGLFSGFLILFFIPNSPMGFNWDSAKNVWGYYQNLQNSPETLTTPTSYSHAVTKAGPSVVSVQAFHHSRPRAAANGPEGDVLIDLSVSVGSGVILKKDGHIVTNYHVIAGSKRVAVQFSNGQREDAQVIGVDRQNDIAVLKVNIKTPLVAELGNSSQVQTGDVVMAIGTPFGVFNNSVTSGIVSAIYLGQLDPYIQTDASINYGNSGGALINTNGQVIGITRSKFSVKSNDEIGISFAVPIDIVKEVVEAIIKNGRVARNWLGTTLHQLTKVQHQQLNPGNEFGSGLMIGKIEKGSPVDISGLITRDFLVAFDGENVKNMGQFRKQFMNTPIGKEVQIKVLRNQETLILQLKLRERPAL
jgi:S1-C subfamily serine protease